MKIDITGHSGCKLEIRNDGNKNIFRKYSSDINYNNRLLSQKNKQVQFNKTFKTENISAPEILADGMKNDLYYIEMPFLPSKSFVSHFEHSGPSGVKDFTFIIKEYFNVVLNNSEIENVPISIVLNKYRTIKRICSQNYFLGDNSREIFYHTDKIMGHLINTIKYFTIPSGFCHGDLTLSNILFETHKNHINLIDFLDNFIESPLMDMVKLRQDTKYYWSFKLYNGHFDKTKLKIILSYIDYDIAQYFKKFEFYNNYYNIFQLINFLRILQYVKNRDIEDFVKKTIYKLIKNIDYELNYSSSGPLNQVS